jgi:rsbT co-antagonist protein RsbR
MRVASTSENDNMTNQAGALLQALRDEEGAIVDGWLNEIGAAGPGARRAAASEVAEVVRSLREGLQAGGGAEDFETSAAWSKLRQVLEDLSSASAAQGRTAGETSVFVLALKKPLFPAVQRSVGSDPTLLADAVWTMSVLVDKLAQHTATTFQKSREQIIQRQQEELLELSTPVVKLWDGVLAVPMIGTLDSSRTQMVMEALLQAIVDTGSELAIIDITGVPTVDTLVAQHLLKTVTAIRLMGADCIISGIRPQIAQTIVHLGIDLQGVSTKATLADALALALRKTGWRVVREG